MPSGLRPSNANTTQNWNHRPPSLTPDLPLPAARSREQTGRLQWCRDDAAR
jgi:hypothetical protein